MLYPLPGVHATKVSDALKGIDQFTDQSSVKFQVKQHSSSHNQLDIGLMESSKPTSYAIYALTIHFGTSLDRCASGFKVNLACTEVADDEGQRERRTKANVMGNAPNSYSSTVASDDKDEGICSDGARRVGGEQFQGRATSWHSTHHQTGFDRHRNGPTSLPCHMPCKRLSKNGAPGQHLGPGLPAYVGCSPVSQFHLRVEQAIHSGSVMETKKGLHASLGHRHLPIRIRSRLLLDNCQPHVFDVDTVWNLSAICTGSASLGRGRLGHLVLQELTLEVLIGEEIEALVPSEQKLDNVGMGSRTRATTQRLRVPRMTLCQGNM
ncbi:hypothetical protein BKA70DRAFT_1235631 [Coprinopsis sp. MPI-PUGE-AT-0042]|nr:hypothetical protein BKA70DRAFT_1235631 [Coprinopsis sp. MPI-PUGE-AT-0042]